jgi:hypothetical protein
VIYYELTLLPRALPSTEESVERATNLFLAFQEYGRIAPANLGLIWHVTPDQDGNGGYGTKVEIMGQWMGSMEEYEVVMKDFNQVLEKHGVGEMQKEKRPLSEFLVPGVYGSLTYSVSTIDDPDWWELDCIAREGPDKYQ